MFQTVDVFENLHGVHQLKVDLPVGDFLYYSSWEIKREYRIFVLITIRVGKIGFQGDLNSSLHSAHRLIVAPSVQKLQPNLLKFLTNSRHLMPDAE